MKKVFSNARSAKQIAMLAVACLSVVVLMASLTSCVPAEQNQAQQENRNYMSQLNSNMDELSDRLADFDKAVATGNVVSMKTQSDYAFKTIDKIENMTAPEPVKEIHNQYVKGSQDLKDALDQYVDLYTKVSESTKENPYNFDNYAKDLKSVQDSYNKGIQELKDADKAAVNG